MNLWLDYFRIEYACISKWNIRWMKQGTQDTVAVLNLSYTHRSRSYARHRKETSTAKMVLLFTILSYQLILLHYTISMPASHHVHRYHNHYMVEARPK